MILVLACFEVGGEFPALLGSRPLKLVIEEIYVFEELVGGFEFERFAVGAHGTVGDLFDDDLDAVQAFFVLRGNVSAAFVFGDGECI